MENFVNRQLKATVRNNKKIKQIKKWGTDARKKY